MGKYNTDLPGSTTTIDPIAVLQAAAASSSNSNLEILSNLVQIFSELAIVTSLIGFVYGLIQIFLFKRWITVVHSV
jgi:tyrosine-specific transport protein